MVETEEQAAMKETEPHQRKFEWFEKHAQKPAWIFPLRKAGLARFAELGFPTLQQEDWRFTNVAPIAKLPFKPVFEATRNGLTPETISQFTFSRVTGTRLVFVNGHYLAELSSPGPAMPGLVAGSLAAALARDPGLIESHLARYATDP